MLPTPCAVEQVVLVRREQVLQRIAHGVTTHTHRVLAAHILLADSAADIQEACHHVAPETEQRVRRVKGCLELIEVVVERADLSDARMQRFAVEQHGGLFRFRYQLYWHTVHINRGAGFDVLVAALPQRRTCWVVGVDAWGQGFNGEVFVRQGQYHQRELRHLIIAERFFNLCFPHAGVVA